MISKTSAQGHQSALFSLATAEIATNLDAPIAYYLVTNIKTGQVSKILPSSLDRLTVSNLSALTSYTFQIAAVSADGISPSSVVTQEITTGAVPVIYVVPTTPALDNPTFTLSSSSETRTANTAATGFTISSTGGAIASFAISATPPGMSFSTSTGALSGTPTSVAVATAYIVTATNASGSATRTFTLTVTSVVYTVGQTGPGGGTIFYYNSSGFACGISLTLVCNYLEVAPDSNFRRLNWSSTSLQNTSTLNSTGTAIGTGHRNTTLVVAAGATDSTTSAIAFTDQYVSPNGTSDWFLPSKDEMTSLSDAKAASLLGGFSLNPSDHWTSSQSASTANQVWIDLNPGTLEWYKNSDNFLIPARAG